MAGSSEMTALTQQIAELTAAMTFKLEELKTDITAEVAGLKERIGAIERRPMQSGDGLLPAPTGVLPTHPPNFQQNPAIGGNHGMRSHKLSFPTFDGKDDPLSWLNRCELFFRGQQTPERDKVWLASYHLLGAAQQWYFQLERDEPSWRMFKDYCNLRFGPPIRNNFLGELAKLQAVGTVDDYQEKFLGLLCHAESLTPAQQVQLFTSGLMEPVRTDVELQNPGSLQLAMALARAYEKRLLVTSNLSRAGGKQTTQHTSKPQQSAQTHPGAYQQRTLPTTVTTTDNATALTPVALPRKQLTAAQMAERRRQGLCFNCEEKFMPGHCCKRLFLLEVRPDDSDDPLVDSDSEDTSPAISLHALSGIQPRSTQTMKLSVVVGSIPLIALLDSGSTHNFISADAAQRAGLQLQSQEGLRVAVANGDSVASTGLCSNLPVRIEQETYTLDCYSIPLAGFDMVLGVQWLSTLGPILWDFQQLTLSFWHHERQITWHGIPSSRHTLMTLQPATTDLMQDLLEEFNILFTEPQCLPPQRSLDHRIHLQPGTPPIAVRPYRYAHAQKDELENQCKDMLQKGTICPSSSAFSAPVLLVKKQDGSWRFCVDYRALNDKTIKDKFPIPVVEELLDELKHAKFFTKLDLRSGYHQVRMHPSDIEKTAFRTHQGLFEFLVMPFGLTNAPATFQALMNEVLHEYLRRFVLVFFDDILIYSASWSEHLLHLRTVFQVLRVHQFFLKKSKCLFGTSSVAYLGHVITSSGVAMDQQKVLAVQEWPVPRSVKALRGFLGLAGYYRRFIKDYGILAALLTKLLKKENFLWSKEATSAFDLLKQALSSALDLQLPDFHKDFIVECDASGIGIGAVLHQGTGPIAFFSKPMALRHQQLAAYEQELIRLVQAIRHWRPYLWTQTFLVRTDHYSLKFLLDQRLATIPQHR